MTISRRTRIPTRCCRTTIGPTGSRKTGTLWGARFFINRGNRIQRQKIFLMIVDRVVHGPAKILLVCALNRGRQPTGDAVRRNSFIAFAVEREVEKFDAHIRVRLGKVVDARIGVFAVMASEVGELGDHHARLIA